MIVIYIYIYIYITITNDYRSDAYISLIYIYICYVICLDCLTHWCELRHTPQGSLVAPTSLAFSVDGERLHCGIHNSIKTFSTSRPGGAGVTRPLPRFGAVSCVTPHPSVLGVSALGSRTGGGESLFKCMASDSLVPRPIL